MIWFQSNQTMLNIINSLQIASIFLAYSMMDFKYLRRLERKIHDTREVITIIPLKLLKSNLKIWKIIRDDFGEY